MKGLRTYLACTLVILTGCSLFAQKFTAGVNKSRVGVGEPFQLDFSVNASGKNFVAPPLSDFNIHSGPNQSTSMQIVNGSMSQSITLSYWLSAKKEGSFTIGAASIQAGGSTLQSNPVTIEVVKGGGAQQAQTPNPAAGQQRQGTQPSGNELFARTIVSKSKIFAGEQLTVIHKVYTRMNLKGFQDIKFPSYNGFWSQEGARTTQYNVSQENIDGVTYSVVEIKRAYLFAQRSGKLQIEPMEVQCVVREKTGKRNDPFEQFFGSDPFFGFNSYKDVVYTVKSNAAAIEVQALPEAGKPTGYSGAVGNFSFNAVIDKDKVKTNDGINLKITISGKGNLKLIDAPHIEFPDEFESYDPKTSENISVSGGSVNGSKTFEYLLIPRREGIYKLQPGDFTYFDTDKKSYIKLPTKEFSITVEKGEGNSQDAAVISSVVKEDVKLVSNDIRYIKTGTIGLKKKGEHFYGSLGFWAGFGAPPLLLLAFLFMRREHIRKNSDKVLVNKRRASKIAQKHLVLAERSMKENKKEEFFANVLSALYSYAGHKLNLPVADLSRNAVQQALLEKKVPAASVEAFVTLMDTCEFARYAPGSQSGNLQETYDKAEESITKIEDEIA